MRKMTTVNINGLVIGGMSLLVVATVAQVWLSITPAMAEIKTKQTEDSDRLAYIQRRVDEIFDRVDK